MPKTPKQLTIGPLDIDVRPRSFQRPDRDDLPGLNVIPGAYFPGRPLARSAIISELLFNFRVASEIIPDRLRKEGR
jgi:hypothetical protein